jgi:hypothetical protein
LSEWGAEQFRLTVFPLPGATTRFPEWWQSTMALPPDETTSNPKRGSSVVSGSLGSNKLILKLEPDRIDWLFVPPGDLGSNAQPPEPEFPTIGPLTESLGAFSDIMERWLVRDDLPEIARIAFGAILKHTEPDRRSAYLRLPEYLPVRVDPDSSDFFFQINLPAASRTGVDDLRVNRLSKWSVVALAVFALRFTGATFASEARPPFGHALRLELDINTVPEFRGPLPRGRFIEVYRELAALGQEIAAEGLDSL